MPTIDTSSRRWTVAVHEAAHVVAARELGWRVRYARITGPVGREGGVTDDTPPRGRDRARLAAESAVISLAGTAASARQRWWLPSGCEHDQRDARAALRTPGVTTTYGQTQQQARHLVAYRWGAIQRIARHLYRHGAL